MIKYRDFILQGKHVATANLSTGTTKVAIREYKNAIVPSNQLLSWNTNKLLHRKIQ